MLKPRGEGIIPASISHFLFGGVGTGFVVHCLRRLQNGNCWGNLNIFFHSVAVKSNLNWPCVAFTFDMGALKRNHCSRLAVVHLYGRPKWNLKAKTMISTCTSCVVYLHWFVGFIFLLPFMTTNIEVYCLLCGRLIAVLAYVSQSVNFSFF